MSRVLINPYRFGGGGTPGQVVRTLTEVSGDGYWSPGNGYWFNGGVVNYIGLYEGNARNTYWVFDNMTIPKGATITSAKFAFACYEVRSGDFKVTMKAAAADSASTPGSFTQINNVTYGSASVAWNLASVAGSSGSNETPNLAPLIQEVINRAGWVSGGDILIAALDNGSDNYFRPRAASDTRPLTITVDYLT